MIEIPEEIQKACSPIVVARTDYLDWIKSDNLYSVSLEGFNDFFVGLYIDGGEGYESHWGRRCVLGDYNLIKMILAPANEAAKNLWEHLGIT